MVPQLASIRHSWVNHRRAGKPNNQPRAELGSKMGKSFSEPSNLFGFDIFAFCNYRVPGFKDNFAGP